MRVSQMFRSTDFGCVAAHAPPSCQPDVLVLHALVVDSEERQTQHLLLRKLLHRLHRLAVVHLGLRRRGHLRLGRVLFTGESHPVLYCDGRSPQPSVHMAANQHWSSFSTVPFSSQRPGCVKSFTSAVLKYFFDPGTSFSKPFPQVVSGCCARRRRLPSTEAMAKNATASAAAFIALRARRRGNRS